MTVKLLRNSCQNSTNRQDTVLLPPILNSDSSITIVYGNDLTKVLNSFLIKNMLGFLFSLKFYNSKAKKKKQQNKTLLYPAVNNRADVRLQRRNINQLVTEMGSTSR